MSVHIVDNMNSIKNNTLQNASIFLRLAADEMVKISTPNTPKDTGRLRMDVVKQVLGLSGKVIWGKKYGVYQESKQFRNYTTAGTGPHFAENAAEQMPGRTVSLARKAGLI